VRGRAITDHRRPHGDLWFGEPFGNAIGIIRTDTSPNPIP
jgi:hypothetical protein